VFTTKQHAHFLENILHFIIKLRGFGNWFWY